MADAEKLTISDAESAYRAISDLIIAYPDYPKAFTANNQTVRWNMTGTGTSIGLFPLQGAIYLKKYISGTYTAQLPFQIVYKCAPTTNKAAIEVQDMLTELAKWLERCAIGFKDPNITLETIARTTPVFVVRQDEKNTEFAVSMQLRYTCKK